MTTGPVSFAGLPPLVAAAPDVELRRWQAADIDQLTSTVNDNLDYLRPWMPWAAASATAESTTAFVEYAVAAFEAGTEFAYGVFNARAELLGGAGLHAHRGPGVLEIGYWIAEQHASRGLGRAVARALTAVAAGTAGVERVEIRCDEANVRSAAIPRALGYDLVGVETRPPVALAETERQLIWSWTARHVS